MRRLLAVLGFLTVPGLLAAQGTALGQQTLGRPFWHVFIAYALVWVFLGGWVISIARRLARVERRLDGE